MPQSQRLLLLPLFILTQIDNKMMKYNKTFWVYVLGFSSGVKRYLNDFINQTQINHFSPLTIIYQTKHTQSSNSNKKRNFMKRGNRIWSFCSEISFWKGQVYLIWQMLLTADFEKYNNNPFSGKKYINIYYTIPSITITQICLYTHNLNCKPVYNGSLG